MLSVSLFRRLRISSDLSPFVVFRTANVGNALAHYDGRSQADRKICPALKPSLIETKSTARPHCPSVNPCDLISLAIVYLGTSTGTAT